MMPIGLVETDGCLYSIDVNAKSAKKMPAKLPAIAVEICALANERIGVIAGNSVFILNSKGKIEQTLEFGEAGTTIASCPAGDWFAVGTQQGTVTVCQAEEQDEFVISDSAPLHNATVTSILFEPEELRFLSAGADRKLFLTHARGTLEPEDRGRSNNHDDDITAMVLATDSRFITGSRDKSCKSWALFDKTKPSTLSGWE